MLIVSKYCNYLTFGAEHRNILVDVHTKLYIPDYTIRVKSDDLAIPLKNSI
jgi:hypothetical protein